MAIGPCPRAFSLHCSSLWPRLPEAGFRGWRGAGAPSLQGDGVRNSVYRTSYCSCLPPCRGDCGGPGEAFRNWWGKGIRLHLLGPCVRLCRVCFDCQLPPLPRLLYTLGVIWVLVGRHGPYPQEPRYSPPIRRVILGGPRGVAASPTVGGPCPSTGPGALWVLLPRFCSEAPHSEPCTCPGGSAPLPV